MAAPLKAAPALLLVALDRRDLWWNIDRRPTEGRPAEGSPAAGRPTEGSPAAGSPAAGSPAASVLRYRWVGRGAGEVQSRRVHPPRHRLCDHPMGLGTGVKAIRQDQRHT